MGLGILGTALAGAAEGLGRSAAPLAEYTARSALAEEAAKVQAQRDQTLAQLARETHRVNTDTDIAAIPRRGAAETEVAIDRAKKQIPVAVEQETKVGAAKAKNAGLTAQAELDVKFSPENIDRQIEAALKLGKADGKMKLDNMLAELSAKSTPEALASMRKIAQATHITPPGQIAEAELAKLKLNEAKTLTTMQGSYAEAIASGDRARAASIAETMAARFYDPAKAKEDAPLKAAVAMLNSMDATEPQKAQAADYVTRSLSAHMAKIGGGAEPQVRYDAKGNAFVKGPDGKPVPYNKGAAAKPPAAPKSSDTQSDAIPKEYFDASGKYIGRPAGPTLAQGIVGAYRSTNETLSQNRIAYLKQRLRSGIATDSEIDEARRANLIR